MMEEHANPKPQKMEKGKSVLKARAEKLARPVGKVEKHRGLQEILLFHLSAEQYGIELKYIKEVYPLKHFTKLTHAPAFLFGIINLRRRILSVIDLKPLFSLPQSDAEGRKMIIIQGEDKEFALLCDGVIGIRELSEDALFAPIATLDGIKQEFLKGVTADSVAVLDGLKLLKSEELVVDQNA